MAVLNADLPTLLDQARLLAPDGSMLKLIETLQRRNVMVEDAVFLEGNLPTGHVFASRTALPTIEWRRLNRGTKPSKSRSTQVTETCGMLEGRSVVDVKLANLGGNAPAFRANEDKAFVAAMGNKVESALLYQSTDSAPDTIQGLSPRLDSTADEGGSQIIKLNAAPSGNDQTSIWLIVWGPESVHGIYPKGSMVGLKPEDLGKILVDDGTGTGAQFLAYVTNWNWDLGLCVQDYRQIVRIANIDTSALLITEDTLVPAMVRAYYRIHDLKAGRPVFYVNRFIAETLHLQARSAVKGSTLTIVEIEGRPVVHVMGIPVHVTDGLINSEAPIA